MAVFLDRSKLTPSYIPKRLLHREFEKQLLTSMLVSGLENSAGLGPARVQVVGGVGAGKTTLCMVVGSDLERRRRDTRHLYVNLRRFSGGRVNIYRFMVRSVAEDAYSASLAAEELLDNLLTYLKKTGVKLLVTFDEADHHVKQSRGRETVVYDFTRLHELSPVRPVNIAAVVFVTRDPGYGGFLESPERSSLGVNTVFLKPYNKEQLVDIITDRVEEAFVKGAVSEEVVQYVAEHTARPPISGDMRYALDLLLYSGNLAEARGKDVVSMEEVRYVLAETGFGTGLEAVSMLNRDEKAVLIAVARALATTGRAYVPEETLETMHRVVCEELGTSAKGLRQSLKKLKQLGFVLFDKGGGVGLCSVDGARLAAWLENQLRSG